MTKPNFLKFYFYFPFKQLLVQFILILPVTDLFKDRLFMFV